MIFIHGAITALFIITGFYLGKSVIVKISYNVCLLGFIGSTLFHHAFWGVL